MSQMIIGPRIFPNGNTNPANPNAWQSTSKVRLTGAATGGTGLGDVDPVLSVLILNR
jgi:hypothetical protein